MPHVNSGGGDDLYSSDEVKVYKDEGEGAEEEKRSSENLSEEKLGLVTESEEDKETDLHGHSYAGGDKNSTGSQDGKSVDSVGSDRLGIPLGGYLFPPFAYTNGATLPGGLGKVPLQPPHALSPLMYDHLGSPPPAHMGIPPVHIDPKTGLPRTHMYTLPPPPPGQFPHPLYGPEFTQMQWNSPPGYPITAAGFRGYPPSLTSSQLARFSPSSMIPPPHSVHGLSHHAIITPGVRQDIPSPIGNENHRPYDHHRNTPPAKRKPYVKKPLNAFMLFMKEQRAKVIEEGSLKESAAINQILGRKWHALDRSEQAKYYEMARKEKELHMQLYPGWSARDNYAAHAKKKVKRKRPSEQGGTHLQGDMESPDKKGPGCYSDLDCPNAKKCRARYGLEAQTQWCKPCRRKKKCVRYHGDDDSDGEGNYPNNLSVATVDSTTTDGELSEIGSPGPARSTGSSSGHMDSAAAIITSHSSMAGLGSPSSSTSDPPFQLYRPSAFHPLPQRRHDFNHNHPHHPLPLSPASSTASGRSEEMDRKGGRRTPDTPSRKPFLPSASTPILAT